jgi:hypothetical protein
MNALLLLVSHFPTLLLIRSDYAYEESDGTFRRRHNSGTLRAKKPQQSAAMQNKLIAEKVCRDYDRQLYVVANQ